ncbi:MAG: tRNA (adenosine(37)-N6)-threonylcarbamoyltransferase complex ATPase subunit type 1 TsaE [Culicoidibacterales bacterium]
MKERLNIQSVEQMQEFGYQLGQNLQAQTTILLRGDLGAGKTTLSQAIARGLEIQERVSSPTFTIVKEYESGRLPLYHIDAYRLESGDDIGIDEYFTLSGVTIVEWPSMITESLPNIYISIEILYSEQGRIVILETSDQRYNELLEQLSQQIQEGVHETVNN